MFSCSYDYEGTSSSDNQFYTSNPLPSTSASVIKRYKDSALKSLRRKALTVAAVTTKPPSVDILGSIMESQAKKFKITSSITDRIDPYKSSFNSPSPKKQTARLRFLFDSGAGCSKSVDTLKKSPSREDDLDLYGDIPPAGAGDDDGDTVDNGDYLYEEGAGGSSGGGGDSSGGGGGREDKDDEKEDEAEDEEEEEDKVEDEGEDEEGEEGEGINEMVIDESVFAQDEDLAESEEVKDPLEIPAVEEQPPSPPIVEEPLEEQEPEQVTPDPDPNEPIFPVETLEIHPEVVRPVFQYSDTSMQIARHLNVDDELVSNDGMDEPEDFPEEPESEPEEPQAESPDIKAETESSEPAVKENGDTSSQCDTYDNKICSISPPVSANGDLTHPSPEYVKKENKELEVSSMKSPSKSPTISNGVIEKMSKKSLKVKARKKSLVDELFGSDVEDVVPPRKSSTDKSGPDGSEDGEIKEKKGKKIEVEPAPKEEVKEEKKSPPRKKSVERKKKKDKNKEGGKKKKKERRRSRSRSRSGSNSSDRRKKHHSRKYSPSRYKLMHRLFKAYKFIRSPLQAKS